MIRMIIIKTKEILINALLFLVFFAILFTSDLNQSTSPFSSRILFKTTSIAERSSIWIQWWKY